MRTLSVGMMAITFILGVGVISIIFVLGKMVFALAESAHKNST